MNENDLLAERFEVHRRHLRAVAQRMLGTSADADDAVQEAWLRLSRADTDDVENLRSWLTTVIARVCLDVLRSRRSRPEEPAGTQLPEPRGVEAGTDPESQAVLADSVGLALNVVLETLAPAERLAFVLHDLFAVPFDDIAVIIGRSPAATRQLASRARRRVQDGGADVGGGSSGAERGGRPDRQQRQIVEAWLDASRRGDFQALVSLLDPDAVLLVDQGPPGAPRRLHGAAVIAGQAGRHAALARFARPALVDGTIGLAVVPQADVVSLLLFTFEGGRIVEIDLVTEAERLAALQVVL